MAIIYALQRAKQLGLKSVEIWTDSELAVRQLNGQYALKNEKLADLAMQVWDLSNEIGTVTYKWIRREDNRAGEVLG